jgi:hypothetical protein
MIDPCSVPQLLSLGRGLFLGLLNGGLLEALHKIRDLIIVIVRLSSGSSLTGSALLVRLGNTLEGGQRIRSELTQDTRKELCEILLLATTIDSIKV